MIAGVCCVPYNVILTLLRLRYPELDLYVVLSRHIPMGFSPQK